jgi:hypothetical protein
MSCSLYTVAGKMSNKIWNSGLLTLAYDEYAMKKLSAFQWQRQFSKG